MLVKGSPVNMFSLIRKSDIKEINDNFSISNLLFENKVRGQKHRRERDNCNYSIPCINNFIPIVNIANIRYRITGARKGQASIAHLFPIS